jgi:hypothetical protein
MGPTESAETSVQNYQLQRKTHKSTCRTYRTLSSHILSRRFAVHNFVTNETWTNEIIKIFTISEWLLPRYITTTVHTDVNKTSIDIKTTEQS